jgi:hypothetical protein
MNRDKRVRVTLFFQGLLPSPNAGLNTMRGKQRIDVVMRLEEPDQVPVMCQLALGHYFLNTEIPAAEIWHSSDAFGEALITLAHRYHFDGILVNLPGRDPDWRRSVDRVDETDSGTVIHWRNGWHTVCPPDDNAHVYREDGRPFKARFEDIDPERLFYAEPHALPGITFPFLWGVAGEGPNDSFPPWQYDTIDYVTERVGDDLSIHGEIFSPFSQFLELLGYEEGLTALMDDPEKSRVCLGALAEGAVALGRGQAAHGVDAVLISSAFAGADFISRRHYQEFVLPFERRVVEGIQEEFDVPVYTHTCGRIGDRLELMQATGTNGIDTMDPPPLGDVELADAKRRIGGELFMKGNIDPVNVILNGSVRDVLFAARRCIEAAAEGGGYILSSACSIAPHAPPENVAMLHEAAKRFGRGPRK